MSRGAPPSPGATRSTGARTVTHADIVQFAALTRDFSRLHTDAAYAARSVFGKRVGHGLLGLALAEGALAREGGGIAVAWAWSFRAPFFAGDRISARATVRSLEVDRGLESVVEEVSVLNQHGAEIQHGRHRLLRAPERADGAWLRAALTAAAAPFEETSLAESGADDPPPPSSADPSARDETGVLFEDLEIGDGFTTPGLTIGAYDVATFLGLIGDTTPWFNDHGLARAGGFGAPLVPPLLGLVLVEGLKYILAPARGVGIPMASLSWRWRHAAPLAVGATVRAEVTISGRRASRSKTDRGMIAQRIRLVDERRTELQRGQHVQMFRRRPHPASPAGAEIATPQEEATQ